VGEGRDVVEERVDTLWKWLQERVEENGVVSE
jgi:hypothetical protein